MPQDVVSKGRLRKPDKFRGALGEMMMLELIVIAMASTVMAVLMVWLWRKLTEFKGVSAATSSSNRSSEIRLSQQQGYVTLPSAVAEQVMLGKRSKGSNKKPWGW